MKVIISIYLLLVLSGCGTANKDLMKYKDTSGLVFMACWIDDWQIKNGKRNLQTNFREKEVLKKLIAVKVYGVQALK